MKRDIKILDLDDTKKELEQLYEKRKKQEEEVRNIEENERYEQNGYNDYEDYEPARSHMEIATEDLYDTELLIEKKEDICEKIEQCEEIKKKYPCGYKRIIRVQTSKFVEDKLNRKEKAQKIAQIIIEKKIKTVGIFGEWGTGKSTFLEYLKDAIPKEKVKIIDIKATEYSDQEKIWAYFFSNMKENIKKDYMLRFCYFFLRIKKNLKKCIMPLFNILLVAIMIIVLFKFDLFNSFSLLMGMDEEKAELFNNGMNLFVTLFFVIKWILPFSSKIVDTIEVTQNNASSLMKREVNEKFGYKLIIKEYIGEIIKIWKNYCFIFCVDELDRCNNKSIMSFLEAVQLLENYENIRIIYSIDADIVLNAIRESGIHNPHNYLKKYVDLKVDLESINSQREYIKSIARDEYGFSEKEIEKIQLALENLEINISMRDYIYILNSLSELKERWINEQIMPEKCRMEDVSEDVINWYRSLPIAVFYFAGSFWPQKIYNDFREYKRAYIKIYHIATNRKIEQQYSDCPAFIKQTRLIDALNVMRILNNMPPIYCEITENSI